MSGGEIKGMANNNKKNIKRLEKNNNSEIIKSASKNTSRILFNAFIKSNPALDSVIGSDGLNLMNQEERRIKKVSEIKSSTKNIIKNIKSSSEENDFFADTDEKISNSKPEYEEVTELIDNNDGTKSEIINVSDKKKSKLTNSPLMAFNNLAIINQKGFMGTNIALRNMAVSNEATSTLIDSAISNLNSIQSSIYQNTLLEENTKRGKQSKLFDIINGNISLLKYLDNKTDVNSLIPLDMIGGSEGIKNILMGFAKNPVELALTAGARMAMQKLMYGSSSGYDPDDIDNRSLFSKINGKFDPNNIGSLLINNITDEEGKISNTIDKLSGNDNKYISNLGDALSKRVGNLKDELLGNGEVSTKNKRDRNTPVQFDRESHTSINKAVPDLLSRLQGNLIARREGKSNGLVNNSQLGSIYNYREGKWDSKENTQNEITDKLKESALFNFKNTNLGKKLSDNNIEDDEAKNILIELSKTRKSIRNEKDLSKFNKTYPEIIKNIFNEDVSGFNVDLFNIKKAINKEYNKLDEDGSSLMAFTEIEGLDNKNKNSQSSSAKVNNINSIKDYSDIEWKNDDLEELKNLFLEIESKLNDINPNSVSDNKEFINGKVDKINNIIDKSSNYKLPSYLSNDKTKSIQDKLGKLSNSVNKYNDIRKDPSSLLKGNLNNNIQKEDNDSSQSNGIVENNIMDNHPLMKLTQSIKGNKNPSSMNINKEPTKTIDDLTKEEKKSKAKEYLKNIISTAYPNQSKSMLSDMKDSDDNKKLDEMKKGLSTANAASDGEDVISQLSGSSKKKVAEDLRGTLKFGSGGAAEKEIGTKKMMNSMLDFSKPGTIAFAGLSASVLAKLMSGKKKEDQEKGLMSKVGSGIGFLGKAGLMLGGGMLAAKFLPKLLGKFLPKGAMSMFNAVKDLPGKLKGSFGKVFDAGKNFFGKGKNLIGKGLGLGKNIFGKGISLGKDLLGKGAKLGKSLMGKGSLGLIKDGFGKGASIAKSGFNKLFNMGGKKSFAGKSLSTAGSFLNKGIKKAGSIGKGIFSTIKSGGKKALGFLGKAKNKLFSKGGMKAAGKFGLKAGLKTALPFIPIVGPIIGAAMWAPDIIKTIKHPIESLKHPIKTLGSFFGLSKHPGDELEAREKEEKPNEDHTGLGRLILSTSKMMFRSSPMFPLAKIGGDMFKTITDNKMKSGPKAEEEIQENMFNDTPIGSLYQMAKGGIDFSTKGGGVIGDWFGRFLVKMEGMVVAMSKMKASGSGSSASSSDGETVSGEAADVDMNITGLKPGQQGRIPKSAAGSWLKNFDIWQPFGNYVGGLSFNGGKHYGIDIGMPQGTSVKCMIAGKVNRTWVDPGGGNSVEIVSPGNIYSWYMHLSNNKIVKKGQNVKIGDEIGKSGATGANVVGAHLHFQVMKGKPGGWAGEKTAVDPTPWVMAAVKKGGGPGTGEGGGGANNLPLGDAGAMAGPEGYQDKAISNLKKEIEKRDKKEEMRKNAVFKEEMKKQKESRIKAANDDVFNLKNVNTKILSDLAKKNTKKNNGLISVNNKFKKILFVGDEIGKLMEPDIQRKVKGIKFENKSNRSYSNDGRQILIDNIKEYNKSGIAVVIQFGIHEGLTSGEVKEIMSMYDKADVVFVNLYVAEEKQRKGKDLSGLVQATNQAITFSQTDIVDWNSKANPNLIKDDGSGFIPNNNGRVILSGLILKVLSPLIGGGGAEDKEEDKEESEAKKKDDDSEKDSKASKSDDSEKDTEENSSSSDSSSSGASDYSFKNGTWYGSITGRDDNRMDEEEQEELNDRLMKRYAKIYGINYEEAKKIDQEQQAELKNKAGKENTESSGSTSNDNGNSESSSAEKAKDKTKEILEKAGNQISKLGDKFQLPTLENSGFSNTNKSTQNNSGNTNSNTTNNNYNQGQGSTVNNTDVKQEFVNGKNKTTNHYNKIVNNYKNSTITNGNTDYIYDYEQYWYSDDLVKMLSNIDRNTLASTKELDRLLEELK